MWTSHLKKWGSIDPLDSGAPRPLRLHHGVGAISAIASHSYYELLHGCFRNTFQIALGQRRLELGAVRMLLSHS